MNEITGDIWQPHTWKNLQTGKSIRVGKTVPLWICITTNGETTKQGKAVMGAGVAKQARDRYKDVDVLLGQKLFIRGNEVNYLCKLPEFGKKSRLLSFPTKNKWRENSSLDLIEASAKELLIQFNRALVKYRSERKPVPLVVIPRPGCDNGKLDWSVVKARIAPILEDKHFLIICPPISGDSLGHDSRRT